MSGNKDESMRKVEIDNETLLRKLEVDNKMLRNALVGVVGADTVEELAQIEREIRFPGIPASDREVMINAINALLATMPPEEIQKKAN